MKRSGLFILVVTLIACATLLGREAVDLSALFGHASPRIVGHWQFVVFELRLPRVLLALLIGASLASSGLLYQTTLYNPLASPFTLGSSAGAALGAYLGLVLFGQGAELTYVLFAFGAALLVSLPIYLLSAKRLVPPEAILLAGVAISFGASALIAGLTYVAANTTIFAYARWSLGDLSTIGYEQIGWIFAPALLPVAYCWLARHRLDAMGGGEELAIARAVNVRGIRSCSVIVVTIAVGASVAMCGPIAFIGLIVPHMSRYIFGQGHAKLSVGTPLLGAGLLIVCDFFGRNLLDVEIPIGVMTAALGTPAFLILLMLQLKRNRN